MIHPGWYPRAAIAAAVSLSLFGCHGGAVGGAPPVPFATRRALVVGSVTGVVAQQFAQTYSVAAGTGNEDPSAYDVLVYDATATPAQTINQSSATAKFLAAGKIVVVLNDSEAHRDAAFKGLLWAHGKTDAPAEAFFIARDKNGTAQREVQVNYPLHVDTTNPGDPAKAFAAPSPSDAPADLRYWLGEVARRQLTTGSDGGAIVPPTANLGQTVLNFDIVQPLVINELSYVRTVKNGYGAWCDDSTPPSNGDIYACPSTNNPGFTGPTVSADAETMLSVLLEPNGSSYQHKIIARQYALMSTYPWPGTAWDFAYWPSNSSGNTYYNTKQLTTNGFNEAVQLFNGPSWTGTYPMAVVEANPQNANNTTQLSTSQDQSESVGISATGGYEDGISGLLGVDWSEDWGWSKAQTVNIADWSTAFSQDPSFALTYLYSASGNTPNTLSAMQNSTYPNGDNQSLGNGPGALNGLQTSAVVAQSESAWLSANGPVPPSEQTFASSVTFTSGEVYGAIPSAFVTGKFANLPFAVLSEPISIDFSSPSLQPPATAPWSLSFGGYSQSGNTATATGTVTLDQTSTSPTTVYLTYVIQPQAQMLTLPAGEACEGNTTSFIPGNSVVNNGAPPFTLSIPAGQQSASFPLSFETFNAATYNVQVVAWLPSATANGATVVNPQSAWCLTPPNTAP